MFADGLDGSGRLWRAAAIVTAAAAIGTLLASFGRNYARISDFLTNRMIGLKKPDGFHSKASGFVSYLLTLFFVVVVVVVVAVVVVGGVVGGVTAGFAAGVVGGVVGVVVVVVVVGTVGLVGAGLGVLAGIGVVVVVVVGAGTVVIVGAVMGDWDSAALVLFFLLLLPLTNACADFWSVAATRRFLGWAGAASRPFLAIVAALVADVVIGGLCLIALLTLLVQVLDLWQTYFPTTLPLDWRAYWQTALADPSQGIMLGFMALTTLMPTILHLCFAVAAMVTHGSRKRVDALADLDARQIANTLTPPARTNIAKRLIAARLYGVALAALLGIVLLWGAWWLVQIILPLLPVTIPLDPFDADGIQR